MADSIGDSWTTAKALRVVLFRGKDDLRYAHAASADEHDPWTLFDIDVG
jgi:hypothetical protein